MYLTLPNLTLYLLPTYIIILFLLKTKLTVLPSEKTAHYRSVVELSEIYDDCFSAQLFHWLLLT